MQPSNGTGSALIDRCKYTPGSTDLPVSVPESVRRSLTSSLGEERVRRVLSEGELQMCH